ncbi:MAG TPA: hypothetical protein VE379_02270 [Vicinamibacterales bacterium]|jgi:hypothetical protein|nr:hypothetical protein [Vicinamibacterales bacterium]
MNTALLITAVLSTMVALAALGVAFVAFRRERARSEARVAALRQLADLEAPLEPDPLHDLVLDREPAAPLADERVASPTMFSAAPERTPVWRRAAAAAAVAAIVGLAGYALLPAPGNTAAAGTQAVDTAPLELLSLRHSAEADRLLITGLVQNPRGGEVRSKVIATAFLFSADGTFLASGRAPLDFATLAPGDESPFVLGVPVNGTVARYRVGFRSEDGRVIAHIDRRAAGTLARTGE